MGRSVRVWCVWALGMLLAFSGGQRSASAQAGGSAQLQGQVTDPSGSSIPGAQVEILRGGTSVRTVETNEQGAYNTGGLTPGKYTIRVNRTGFTGYEGRNVDVTGRLTLDIKLNLATEVQTVTVEEAPNAVSTDPASSVGAIVLKGEDIQALSDNPDDLASDLQALAGPSAGPNGGQIFIDGFTGGRLPPKESIREIRVNQNPFSAEFDRIGFGRIEIFTKPGSDKFRGTAFFNFGDRFLNTRNPFLLGPQPAFQARQWGGNFGGPLGKKSSFFVDFDKRDTDDNTLFRGTQIDPASLTVNNVFSQPFITPSRRTSVAPRWDYAINSNNTLIVRYNYSVVENQNQGSGNFDLLSRGLTRNNNEHTFQITETSVLSPKAINEARFQFDRVNFTSAVNSLNPAIVVQDAVTLGGSNVGNTYSTTNSYEFGNNLSLTLGAHAVKIGGRLRGAYSDNFNPTNFNGTFTFAGVRTAVPELNPQGQPTGNTLSGLTSVQQYLRTLQLQALGLPGAQIRSLGGGASQFSIAAGNPLVGVNQTDLGLFVQDDWRLRPNVTLSLGLRWEGQTNINNRSNWAPRIALAYGLGGKRGQPPKTVIRTGFAMFYDRVSADLTEQIRLLNGTSVRQYTISNPEFYPSIPSVDQLSALGTTNNRNSLPTVRQIDPSLRVPMLIQSVIGVERQVTSWLTTSAFFINTRGIHQLRTRNINAPVPGSATVANPLGLRPYGVAAGNILNFESTGVLDQRQVFANANIRVTRAVSLFTFYGWGHANGDTDGANSQPADNYNLKPEYGRTAFDIRHRMGLGGSFSTWGKLRWAPFMIWQSSRPYNVIAGQDLNLDQAFLDRPSITSPNTPGAIPFQGVFLNPRPLPGEVILPRNYGVGPGFFSLNLRMSRTWGFGETAESAARGGNQGGGPGMGRGGFPGMGGPRGGGPRGGGGGGGGGGFFQDADTGKRYNLTASISARNLLNTVNFAPPSGNLLSPFFGQSTQAAGGGFGPGGGGPGGGGGNSAAGNRRIELQLRFSF